MVFPTMFFIMGWDDVTRVSSCQNCCMWVCANIIKMVNCMHRSRSNFQSNLKPFNVVYSSLRWFFPARFFKPWDHASRELRLVKTLELGSLCKNIVGNIWGIIRASYKILEKLTDLHLDMAMIIYSHGSP